MSTRFIRVALAAVFLISASVALALPDTGQTNAEVLRTNPQISSWASSVVDWQVGPMDYANVSTSDSNGFPVSDPYPTAFASGGFDLTGVAIMNPPGAVPASTRSFGAVKSLFVR